MKIMYGNLVLFTKTFSLLIIEIVKNHFNFKFLSFNFFLGKISLVKQRLCQSDEECYGAIFINVLLF
jgi:hypothetical protein